MRTCKKCNAQIDSKNARAVYCSPKCKVSSHREKLKNEKPSSVCWFCGSYFRINGRTKFCSDKHKVRFHKRKEMGKPIILLIDPRTQVETKKYDKIPEVISYWKNIRKDFLSFDFNS